MKYDKKIKSLIKKINYECSSYLAYVSTLNECAVTDRVIENVIELSKELENYHEKRFTSLSKDNSNIKKELER